MLRFLRARVRYFDWALFGIALLLLALSLLAIYSIDLNRAGGDFYNFRKQMLFAALGIASIAGFAAVDWRFFRALTWPLYGAGLVSLLAVLISGQTRRATASWFTVGGFALQPVEFAKVILILTLALYFSRNAFIPSFKTLAHSFLIFAGYFVPALLQPDLGGASMLFFIWIAMLAFIRLPRRFWIGLVSAGAVVLVIGWFFVFKDYQKDRLRVFLHPGQDTLGRGYNVAQSLVAVGSGGIFGRGLGGGSQSQLRFLPEAQTDFIFAVLAEELGFAIILLLLCAYGFLLFRLTTATSRISDNFSLFAIVGTVALFGMEAAANMGMNLGLLPVAGLTLPLVSYGGSSLLSKCILLGIVQSMRIRSY